MVKDESPVRTVFHFSMLSWQQWWSRIVYLKISAVISLDKLLDIVAPVSGIDIVALVSGIDIVAPVSGIDIVAPVSGIDIVAPCLVLI